MISTPATATTNVVSPSSAPPANSTVLDEAHKTAASSSQGQQNLRNGQILEASLQVSIQVGNDGLALLYRTAIDEINQMLEPELGPDALQNAAPQDHSAEATAGRIVSMSTAMFDAYAARYPDKALEEVAKDFVTLIRSGFEQGFKEAEDILNSLGVLGKGGPVSTGLALTYELVNKAYDDWLAGKLAAVSDAPKETDNAA